MDWRNIENEKEKYAAYLCSREWSVLKEAVKERSGGKCERCKVLPGDAVHHLTYERKYKESLDDLQHNCNACHEFTHGKNDFDPAVFRHTLRWLSYTAAHNLRPCPIECFASWPKVNTRIDTGIRLLSCIRAAVDSWVSLDAKHDHEMCLNLEVDVMRVIGFAVPHRNRQRDIEKECATPKEYIRCCEFLGLSGYFLEEEELPENESENDE